MSYMRSCRVRVYQWETQFLIQDMFYPSQRCCSMHVSASHRSFSVPGSRAIALIEAWTEELFLSALEMPHLVPSVIVKWRLLGSCLGFEFQVLPLNAGNVQRDRQCFSTAGCWCSAPKRPAVLWLTVFLIQNSKSHQIFTQAYCFPDFLSAVVMIC